MRDAVAEVLRQRAALDRGAGAGLVVSILLHGALMGAGVYSVLHVQPPKAATMVNIQFASMPSAAPAAARKAATPPKPAAPKIEEPKIVEPKPVPDKPAPVEKNTVPMSPFGRSTKKGSEAPEPAKPAPAQQTPSSGLPGASTAEVPIGGAGVTGLEGGDFPYSLYIGGMQRRIGSNWFRPQVQAGTATIVYFRILRDGTITEARVETSSGNATFDRAALSAVRSSTPLNPLPFGYDGTYLGVHLTFR